MRADITKEGNLAVVPETYAEDLALKSWLTLDNPGESLRFQVFLEDSRNDFTLLPALTPEEANEAA